MTCEAQRTRDRKVCGVTAPPEVAYWVLAEVGRRYVLYVRGVTAPLRLALGAGAVDPLRVTRLDPKSGQTETLEAVPARVGVLGHTPPDGRDWVVVLRAAGNARE